MPSPARRPRDRFLLFAPRPVKHFDLGWTKDGVSFDRISRDAAFRQVQGNVSFTQTHIGERQTGADDIDQQDMADLSFGLALVTHIGGQVQPSAPVPPRGQRDFISAHQ